MRNSLRLVAASIIAHLQANAVTVETQIGTEASADAQFDFYGTIAGGNNSRHNRSYSRYGGYRRKRKLSSVALYLQDEIMEMGIDVFYKWDKDVKADIQDVMELTD